MAIRKQYKGPFPVNGVIELSQGVNYEIGISIGEKDFMLYQGPSPDENGIIVNFIDAFSQNMATIKIGRTFIYQTGGQGSPIRFIRFQTGAPVSTIVDILAVPSSS